MTAETLDRALDLLLSSDRRAVQLQLFGGEALMRWDLVQRAVEVGSARAGAAGKDLRFILSSNGWSLDDERLAWLRRFPVKLELSLDRGPDVQNRFRRALDRGEDSYAHGIAPRAAAIQRSGLDHEVIMVVHPENAARLAESFAHIADLGFQRVQINFALGFAWTKAQMRDFTDGLMAVGRLLRARPDVRLVNLEGRADAVRLNGEVTVDWDGAIYGGNGFLHETPNKARFRVGHLDDLGHFDRYWMDAPDNDSLLRWSYPPEVTQNNLAVGALMASFVRWMQGQEGRDEAPLQA